MIFKLQKRTVCIMTNSKYNAHTETLFKELEMLKVSDIFDVQCMKFWYKFVNKSLPEYFGTIFTLNNELYQIETCCVRTNSICLLPELSVLVMFWGAVSQNCCRNILGLLPKGPTPTVLNCLSLCLRHIFLGLTSINVLITIVIPANTMLGYFSLF